MTDNTNKGFWERMARIYTAFMSKNDTAYEQICKLSEQYIDSEKSVLELACGTGQITFLMAGKIRLVGSNRLLGKYDKRS